jgi:hypothetical protein
MVTTTAIGAAGGHDYPWHNDSISVKNGFAGLGEKRCVFVFGNSTRNGSPRATAVRMGSSPRAKLSRLKI